MKCILIDDIKTERIKLKLLLEQIEGLGIVEEFDVAMNAYRYVQSNEVDLVFLDLDMPRLHGLDFLERYKSKIPECIIVSVEIDSKDQSLSLGALSFIEKPG